MLPLPKPCWIFVVFGVKGVRLLPKSYEDDADECPEGDAVEELLVDADDAAAVAALESAILGLL